MKARTDRQRAGLLTQACLGVMLLVVTTARADESASPASRAVPGVSGREGDSTARAVWQRGARIPPKDRTVTETKLEACVRPIDPEARKHPSAVLERLTSEFGVPEAELLMERNNLGYPWSDIVIAHTLGANSGSTLSAARLIKLHDDGLGWSEVAYGLELDLKQFVAAVRVEARVALGQERADGKVAVIRATSAPEDGSNAFGSSVDGPGGAPREFSAAPPRIKGSGS